MASPPPAEASAPAGTVASRATLRPHSMREEKHAGAARRARDPGRALPLLPRRRPHGPCAHALVLARGGQRRLPGHVHGRRGRPARLDVEAARADGDPLPPADEPADRGRTRARRERELRDGGAALEGAPRAGPRRLLARSLRRPLVSPRRPLGDRSPHLPAGLDDLRARDDRADPADHRPPRRRRRELRGLRRAARAREHLTQREAPSMSTTAAPDLPPYAPARLLGAPFPERVRLVCRTWASQVAPTPPLVMAMYWTKYLVLYVGGWAFFVSFDAGYPGFLSPGGWAFT